MFSSKRLLSQFISTAIQEIGGGIDLPPIRDRVRGKCANFLAVIDTLDFRFVINQLHSKIKMQIGSKVSRNQKERNWSFKFITLTTFT